MDREIPAFNQLVVNKIQQKNLQSHYQRLYNIKSHHSRLYPASSQHSRHNRKAVQLQEQKQTQIQRNNVVLFNKMMKIMKRNDPCNQPANSNNRPQSRPNTELSRIQQQNRTMYERLQKQKPTIDHRKLQEQRKKQENILKFLGKYSAHSLQNTQSHSFRSSQVERASLKGQSIKPNHYLQKPQISTPVQLIPRPRYDSSEFDQQIDEYEMKVHLQRDNRAKKAYSSTFETNPKKQEQPMSRLRTRQAPRSAKDIILFKTHKLQNNQTWQICIIRSHQAYQIRASTLRSGQRHQLKLTLNESEGNQLLEATNYNYNSIVNRLVINQESIELEDNELEKEEFSGDNYSNEPQEIISAPKKTVHYYNPSHISQQNQEESYRPNESIHQTFSPYKNKRIDSLGSEEVGYRQLEQSQCKPQEKALLEQIAQNQSGLQTDINVGETGKNVDHQAQRERVYDVNEIGHYEQALDEEIL